MYYMNSLKNSDIEQKAKEALSAFAKEQIDVIPLKGIYSAGHIYKNIALRPVSDIDLLVRKEELAAADRILGSLGYRTPENYKDALDNKKVMPINSLGYARKDDLDPFVHLHWHLINTTWPLDNMVEMFDIGRVWRAASGQIWTECVLTPCPRNILSSISPIICSITFSIDGYFYRICWRPCASMKP